ncbi:MAG: L-lysine dehydrogenase [Proteobacteria bacterium]|nr:L-lysine dehydrogenase [Pseudomonadota bacterium]
MSARIKSILVAGMGNVGTLVALLLKDSGFSVTAADAKPDTTLGVKTAKLDVKDSAALRKLIKSHDAIISCLPYHLNLGVAKLAHANGKHYFDLTEDVPTTNAIQQMAKKGSSVMAPQCGLAPGFIGIVGASLSQSFEKLRSIELRVGALPQHPKGVLGYAFNWSPEGVVNEYLNDCEVIRSGKIKTVPAMQDLETIVISGIKLEAFTTSGGLGTMCETFKGKVDRLDYKTMRYPGHCKLMKFFFHELLMKDDRKAAGNILVNAKPPVDEDVVYVHAGVEGWIKGVLKRHEFVRAYTPITIGKRRWRAIAWTTAASAVAVIEMVANGTLASKGFIKQEDINLKDFLATRTGKLYNQNA